MKNINKKRIGKRIKQIRLNAGLNQTRFAKAIDERATKNTVSYWEHGKCVPRKERLLKIAQLGHTTVDGVLCIATLQDEIDQLYYFVTQKRSSNMNASDDYQKVINWLNKIRKDYSK